MELLSQVSILLLISISPVVGRWLYHLAAQEVAYARGYLKLAFVIVLLIEALLTLQLHPIVVAVFAAAWCGMMARSWVVTRIWKTKKARVKHVVSDAWFVSWWAAAACAVIGIIFSHLGLVSLGVIEGIIVGSLVPGIFDVWLMAAVAAATGAIWMFHLPGTSIAAVAWVVVVYGVCRLLALILHARKAHHI